MDDQTKKDTAKAKSRQNGGDGGTSERMSEREAAAGLNLAGNDTMSGRVGLGPPEIPTASQPRTGNIDQSFDDFSPPETSAPGVASVHAFQLVKVGTDTLCVRQGTIGSVIPTISGTELEVDYTENELSLPGTSTREYWLKVTLDSDGEITTVTIETTEPGDDSATQAKLLLGSVETDSGDVEAFNSNLSGSQSLASCGTTHYFGLV